MDMDGAPPPTPLKRQNNVEQPQEAAGHAGPSPSSNSAQRHRYAGTVRESLVTAAAMESVPGPSAHVAKQAKFSPTLPTASSSAQPETLAPDNSSAWPAAGDADALGAAFIPGLFLERPEASVDVTQRGVSLAYLEQVVAAGKIQRDWSIQEAVDRFVRPFTSSFKCPLHSMVPAQHRGLPRFFVSHTWSGKVGDLLRLLLQHSEQQARLKAGGGAGRQRQAGAEEGEQSGFRDWPVVDAQHANGEHAAVGGSDGVSTCTDMLVWLDIMAIPQHPYEDRGVLLNEDVMSLARVVAATERTLLCLDANCTVLTRIWCLFEVWQTLLAKGVPGLLLLMPVVSVDTLKEVFSTFDVVNARATQLEDRDRILMEITESVGATQLNLQLKESIVDSAVFEAETSSARGADLVPVLEKAAQMLLAAGRYSSAVEVAQRAMLLAEQAAGPDSVLYIEAVWQLANCLRKDPASSHENRDAEVEALLLKALDGWRRVLGEEDPAAVSAAIQIAGFYVFHDRPTEAEPLLRGAVAARTRMLGPEHPKTVSSVIELVGCLSYVAAGDGRQQLKEGDRTWNLSAEAEAELREEVQQLEEHLRNMVEKLDTSQEGAWDCISSWIDHSAAGFDDVEQVVPLFRNQIADTERRLGRNHPDTIQAVKELADFLCDDDQHDAAAELYQQVVQAWQSVLGRGHPTTVAAMTDLAGTLVAGRRLQEARELYGQALELYRVAYGPDNDYAQSVEVEIGELDAKLARGDLASTSGSGSGSESENESADGSSPASSSPSSLVVY